jgi:hypothetical protein
VIWQQGWDGRIAKSRDQQFQKQWRIEHINNREINVLIFVTEKQEPARKMICVISFPLPTLSVKNRGKKGEHYRSKYSTGLKYVAHLTGGACIDSP